jgi:hypothetical protein
MCAPFRRIVSHVPRPEPSDGIDENAKMTAAHATTGIHLAATAL